MTGAIANEPKQDRSRATRARLLEAAVSCLAEVGWSGSTVSVVAERAGVSRGAAQHHFPTRESLFVAAVEHVSTQRHAEVRVWRAEASDRAPSTREVVETVVGLYTSELFRAALALWVTSASEPQLRELVVPLETRIGRDVHRLTVDLLAVDEERPGVREAIQATLDLARGLGLADLLTDDGPRRQRIVAQWADQLDAVLHPPS